MISNACATVAILNILLNIPEGTEDVELGDELKLFREFTAELDSESRGDAIGNSDSIRTAHNSFARSTCFSFEDQTAGKDDDAFHFVGYVSHQTMVYELDGLQKGPLLLGDAPQPNDGLNWLDVVRPELRRRMGTYGDAEVRFSLLAITGSREIKLTKQLSFLSDASARAVIQSQIRQVEDFRESWRIENKRRRFNYIPLAVALLKVLSEKGELNGLVEKGIEKAKVRRQTKKDKGAK